MEFQEEFRWLKKRNFFFVLVFIAIPQSCKASYTEVECFLQEGKAPNELDEDQEGQEVADE